MERRNQVTVWIGGFAADSILTQVYCEEGKVRMIDCCRLVFVIKGSLCCRIKIK